MALKINEHSPSLNLTFRLWLYTIWPIFIKIGCLVLLYSCLQTKWQTDTHTDTQTDKSDHNTPSQNLWRGNKKKVSTDRASMILRKHEQSVLQSFFGFVYYPFTNFVMGYCDHFCLSVCLCVCVSVTLSVNTIKGELSIRYFSKIVRFWWKLVYLFSFRPWTRIFV